MARLIIDLLKLVIFCGILLLTLVIAALVVLQHYAGISEAFTLLHMNSRPLGLDPLAGSVFTAIAGNAGFAEYAAATIALMVFVGSGIVVWTAMHLGLVCLGAPAYFNEGRASEFWRTVGIHIFWLLLIGLPLCVLLWWDAALYVLRFWVGASQINVERDAVRAILAGPRLDNIASTFSQALITGPAYWGYISVTFMAPAVLEWVCFWFAEALSVLLAPLDATTDDYEEYDEEYDYGARAANDADPDADAGAEDHDAAPAFGFRPAAGRGFDNERPDATNDDVDDEDVREFTVIGGRNGERVTIREALARKDRFHVSRDPLSVFELQYWRALHPETDPDPNAEAA